MSQQGVGSTAIGVGKLAPVPVLGTWYHVAMVYSTDKKVTLYVDGVSQGTSDSSYTGSTATGTSNSFYFGAFNGAMSDLKIFNTAKNQAEIQTLMDQ
ncbi:MAG TPA: LamG domain-containing protein, partial [Treponemataceae bacterium]|nr:LamG domain-containing protein [Treponemataceae bacterium]